MTEQDPGYIDKIWPEELLYWRRLGSREISDYLENTQPKNRLILVTWGVLEAHGPWLPVANDSMMAQVATDKVALRLYNEHGIQPIIFNSFADIGSYSATRDFPGAVAIEDYRQYQPGNSRIQDLWESVVGRLEREGFRNFFLINGDGGNWQNYIEDWPVEAGLPSLFDQINNKFGVKLDGSNWDQEGGNPWRHADHYEHAFINWLCWYAPEFERFAAIRAGLKPVSEDNLKIIDGASLGNLDEQRRKSNWAQYPGQDKLRAVTEFSFAKYQRVLYEDDGVTPRKEGGIADDFEAKIEKLMGRVVEFLQR